ncbi:PLD nuclease N-terminal domain-containing protein [Arthrobacter crystallopoietes]|jgi:hypothetical protein|uniref:PLD nuclease N-terminal domain-containing protein n=1 Tax=Crystallibacter crystallopoietes TaxID=37928 RepID=UPI0011115B46|nr:PLD nuclease N-terminal domain-containing protein [Arthrobacter crystallopoietes]QTG81007.1 PLDc_N domain-containing protein [Arthrobacter crystallopoietes]
MARVYIMLVVLAVAIIVYALIECIRSRPQEVRSISKPGWILTIILVPLIGALLWFAFGRPRASKQAQQAAPRRPMAPDEDVAFLRNLDVQRRQRQREEALKKREEELKKQAKDKGRSGTNHSGTNQVSEEDPENPNTPR